MITSTSPDNLPVIDVIIPAYNEESSIGKVIAEIPRKLVRNVIVCNNNSSDNTSGRAMEAGAIVVDAPRKGYGSACMAGINYIARQTPDHAPDIIVFMDGDYSDYPVEMPKLIEPIRKGKDLVIGSRVLGGYAKGSMTAPQVFGNWIATTLIRLLYGYRYTDLGPFRAIRWDKLVSMQMQDRNFGWTAEMQVKALKHKLHCVEVPVSYRKRMGRSKISGTIKGTLLAGHKILWTIFKSVWANAD